MLIESFCQTLVISLTNEIKILAKYFGFFNILLTIWPPKHRLLILSIKNLSYLYIIFSLISPGPIKYINI